MFRTALALLSACAILAFPAAPALADDGDVAWTVRTDANSFGADRSSFTYSINPGSRLDDGLVVANRGTAPLTLGVYASDGYTTDTGQLDLLARDKKSVGIGAWVQAGKDSVTIAPGATAKIPFAVNVPSNAPPGDYVGGILTSLTQATTGQGINVDRRLGIRIKLRVSGELKPNLTVEDLRMDYAGTFNPFGSGDATISYTIHNTGNAVLSAKQSMSVAGPFGWMATDAGDLAAPPDLLPGESWEVSVPVHGVAPAFRLAATTVLMPLMTDASGATTSLEPVSVTADAWALPWTQLVLLVLLVALVVGVIVLSRRRRVGRKAREDARVQEAVEQALRGQGSYRP
ncbi:COG1470 family protein [Herbidospora sp. RD11066]